MPQNPFMPTVGGTKILAATAVTASTPLDLRDNSDFGLRVYNAGPNVAFARWGVGPQVALATDMPLVPGVVEVFGKGVNDDTFAAISPGGTATVYVTGGMGL